jgi:hypothetical protein
LVDHKAALINAGTFAVGAASFIAGTFVLPDDFGNFERVLMVAAIAGVYSFGHVKGQQYAESVMGSDKREMEHQLEMTNDRLSRLADAEERADRLQRLLDAEKTLSSSYREKNADLSARLEMRQERAAAEKEERKLQADEERKRANAREWVRGLTPYEKRLLLKVRGEGALVVGPMSEDALVHGAGGAMNGLDHTALAGDDDMYEWKLTLNKRGKYGVDSAMDMLLDAEEHAEGNTKEVAE